MKQTTLANAIAYRSCNFCGGESFVVSKSIDLAFPRQIYSNHELACPGVGNLLRLQYLECCDCGLVFINPLTRFSDIDKRSFDGERNIVAWAELDYSFYEEEKRASTVVIYSDYDFESFRRHNRVLDVSCGPGVALQWLRDVKGWEVWGADPDQFSVRQAKEKYGLDLINGLIDDVTCPDEFFDLIVMDNSLEHTFDPLGALLTAYRLLRKGGGLMVFVPNCDGVSTTFLNDNAYWGHWFFYRPPALCKALWDVGYEVQRVLARQFPIPAALEEKGIDLTPFLEGLVVDVSGNQWLKENIHRQSFYADFFSLMATKPENSGVLPTKEGRLREIASASLIERERVEILPGDRGKPTGERLEIDTSSMDSVSAEGPLIPGRHFGQTFMAHSNGLCAVEISIATYAARIPRGELELHLRAHPDDAEDIACLTVPASEVEDNAYIRFEFNAITDSADHGYFVFLECREIPLTYGFAVWRSSYLHYPDGDFFVDGVPQRCTMKFRTLCAE